MAWHQPLRVNCTVFEVWGSGSHSGFVCPERVRALSFWQGRRAVWRRDKLSPFYLCVLACEWLLFLRKGEGAIVSTLLVFHWHILPFLHLHETCRTTVLDAIPDRNRLVLIRLLEIKTAKAPPPYTLVSCILLVFFCASRPCEQRLLHIRLNRPWIRMQLLRKFTQNPLGR